MTKKEKDYIKARNVGKRLYGVNRERDGQQFKHLIASLNETVEQILNKTELTEEQERQAERMGIKKVVAQEGKTE
jgi:hypothetical protein